MPSPLSMQFTRIYFGVPQSVGRVFRATKAPTILLLCGTLGAGLAIGLTAGTYMATHPGSLLPLKVVAYHINQMHEAIALQYQQMAKNSDHPPPQLNPIPPNISRLVEQMTPREKSLAVQFSNAVTIDGVIVIVSLIWWVIRFRRFLKSRSQRPPRA